MLRVILGCEIYSISHAILLILLILVKIKYYLHSTKPVPPLWESRSRSPWVGVALSESPEWVSPGRGCLVRKPRMGLPESWLPCPKAPNGSPRVGGALSESSEWVSSGRGCLVGRFGEGIFCAE